MKLILFLSMFAMALVVDHARADDWQEFEDWKDEYAAINHLGDKTVSQRLEAQRRDVLSQFSQGCKEASDKGMTSRTEANKITVWCADIKLAEYFLYPKDAGAFINLLFVRIYKAEGWENHKDGLGAGYDLSSVAEWAIYRKHCRNDECLNRQ